MANWHINDKGEVHPCRARSGNCRFGGASGEENHFSSRESAELSLAKKDGEYSALGTRRKRAPLDIGKAKTETRVAVETLLDKGVAVNTTKTLDGLPLGVARHSQVDILEEDLKGISLDVLKGKQRPF